MLGEIPESKGSRPIIIIGHVRLPVAEEELIPDCLGLVLGERSLRSESDCSVVRHTLIISDIVSLHNEVDVIFLTWLGKIGGVVVLCFHTALARVHGNRTICIDVPVVNNAIPYRSRQSQTLVITWVRVRIARKIHKCEWAAAVEVEGDIDILIISAIEIFIQGRISPVPRDARLVGTPPHEVSPIIINFQILHGTVGKLVPYRGDRVRGKRDVLPEVVLSGYFCLMILDSLVDGSLCVH